MTKDEFLAFAVHRSAELQALNKLNNFYDYEKQFVSIWKDLERKVLEQILVSFLGTRGKKDANHHLGTYYH